MILNRTIPLHILLHRKKNGTSVWLSLQFLNYIHRDLPLCQVPAIQEHLTGIMCAINSWSDV